MMCCKLMRALQVAIVTKHRSLNSKQLSEECCRLRDLHAKAMARAFHHLRAAGPISPEFLKADQAANEAWRAFQTLLAMHTVPDVRD